MLNCPLFALRILNAMQRGTSYLIDIACPDLEVIALRDDFTDLSNLKTKTILYAISS